MRTSEALNRAADVIEERGWTQGSRGWYWETGSVCLEGALLAAAGVPYEAMIRINHTYGISTEWLRACPLGNAVREYLNSTGRRAKNDLYDFNDAAESMDEVVEVLRSAAMVEEIKESEFDLPPMFDIIDGRITRIGPVVVEAKEMPRETVNVGQ